MAAASQQAFEEPFPTAALTTAVQKARARRMGSVRAFGAAVRWLAPRTSSWSAPRPRARGMVALAREAPFVYVRLKRKATGVPFVAKQLNPKRERGSGPRRGGVRGRPQGVGTSLRGSSACLSAASRAMSRRLRPHYWPAGHGSAVAEEALDVLFRRAQGATVPSEVITPPAHLARFGGIYSDERLWPKLIIAQNDEKDMKTTRGINGLPDMGDGVAQRITTAFYDGFNALEAGLEPLRKLPPTAAAHGCSISRRLRCSAGGRADSRWPRAGGILSRVCRSARPRPPSCASARPTGRVRRRATTSISCTSTGRSPKWPRAATGSPRSRPRSTRCPPRRPRSTRRRSCSACSPTSRPSTRRPLTCRSPRRPRRSRQQRGRWWRGRQRRGRWWRGRAAGGGHEGVVGDRGGGAAAARRSACGGRGRRAPGGRARSGHGHGTWSDGG